MDGCGKIVSESNAKADLLKEVVINQKTSLAPDACVFGPSPLNVTFDLGNIYPSGVQRVLCSLPNKTLCGSDKISYHMMKEAGQGLVGPLVSLINASLRLRQVPDECQKAIIKPIFKGGKKDRRDPSSYRPLTSCAARTMEKLLNARISHYLIKQNSLQGFININQVSNRTTQPSRSSAFWSTNGRWLWKREPMLNQSL